MAGMPSEVKGKRGYWYYIGDYSLEYGGRFYDLSDFLSGSASAVSVVDLDGAFPDTEAYQIQRETLFWDYGNVTSFKYRDYKHIRPWIDTTGSNRYYNGRWATFEEWLADIAREQAERRQRAQETRDYLNRALAVQGLTLADLRGRGKTTVMLMIVEAIAAYHPEDDPYSETDYVRIGPGANRVDNWSITTPLRAGSSLFNYVKKNYL